ncbi:hypothetical protein WUBG_07645, partial [Wuchereria bancrofti]
MSLSADSVRQPVSSTVAEAVTVATSEYIDKSRTNTAEDIITTNLPYHFQVALYSPQLRNSSDLTLQKDRTVFQK